MITHRQESNVRPFLGAQLSALARRHGVPGAQVAIHHNGETVAVEVGEAEYRTGRRVRPDTAFPVGSITKAFTATLALTLVADGDVELDGPVGEYLPELAALGGDITLRQLLSHTSGLASGPDTESASARRYLQEHCQLVLAPGTGFSYSNMGYIAVGRLIETVTGMAWVEAMESILLRPLGIAPTFVGLPGEAASPRPPSPRLAAAAVAVGAGGLDRPAGGGGLALAVAGNGLGGAVADGGLRGAVADGGPGRAVASGHSVTRAGKTRPVRQSLSLADAPTGALAASALDLVALARLHLAPGNPALLPADVAAAMRADIAATVPFGLADGWGAGLALYRDGDTDWVGHDGNADGTSCYLRIDPVGGWIVAFTSNANSGTAMWRDLLGALHRSGVPIGQSPPWRPTARPIPPPRSSAGTYANGDVEYVVAIRDAAAYLSVDGQPFAALTVYEDLSFSVRDPLSGAPVLAGRFTSNPETGRVDGIQLGGRVGRPYQPAARDARSIRIA